jgi:hypothetical protein
VCVCDYTRNKFGWKRKRERKKDREKRTCFLCGLFVQKIEIANTNTHTLSLTLTHTLTHTHRHTHSTAALFITSRRLQKYHPTLSLCLSLSLCHTQTHTHICLHTHTLIFFPSYFFLYLILSNKVVVFSQTKLQKNKATNFGLATKNRYVQVQKGFWALTK